MEQTKNLIQSYLRVTRHLSQRFRGGFGQLELTFPQALVLAILEAEDAMPIGSLAQYTGSANSTVSGIVDRLEKQGLVRRIRSEDDRRVIYVTLTEHGRTLRERTEPDAGTGLSDALQTLSDEELQEICAALDKLNRTLEQAKE